MRCDRTVRRVMPLLAVLGTALVYSHATRAQEPPPPENQSVADAARQAREAKKNAAKASKVISDDDIDTKKVKPGAEGLNVGSQPKSDSQPPNPAAVSAAEAADQAAGSVEKNAERKGDDPEIASAKAEVAEAAAQLDLLQRGLALDQDSYYSKPDYVNDKAGKSKLDAEQQQISDKQQEVDRRKARLAELQEARNRKKAAAGSGSSDRAKPAEAIAPTPPSTAPPS